MTTDESTDFDLLPPAERIEVLRALRADPASDVDPAELAAALGAAHLAHFDAERDLTALAAGVEELEQAVARSPEHPSAPQWRFDLGLGYTCRADHRADPTDYERAIAQFSIVRAEVADDEPGQETVALTLAEAHWRHFRLVRQRHTGAPVVLLPEAERAAAAVATLVVDIDDPELAGYGRLLEGLARLEVFHIGDRRADLDTAIALLDDALQHVDLDTPEALEASLLLCMAYEQRTDAANQPDRELRVADLTAAIRVGRRAALVCPTGEPGSVLLHETLACVHHDRWELTEDPADLDHAISDWRHVSAHQPGAESLAFCGLLLRERAERNDDGVDADEAIRLLQRLLNEPAGESLDLIRRYELARAYRTRWRLGHDLADLGRAAGCLAELIALEPPTDELLTAHRDRLMIGRDLVRAEDARAPGQLPASGTRLWQWLTEARAAWERASDANPLTHTTFAGVLAATEIYAGWLDLDALDLGRVARLIGIARTAPDPPPGWTSLIDTLDAVVQHIHEVEQADGRQRESLHTLARATTPELAPDIDEQIRELGSLMLYERAASSGDRRALRVARRRTIEQETKAGSPVEPEVTVASGLLDVRDLSLRGDQAGAVAEGRRLLDLIEQAGAGHRAADFFRSILQPLLAITGGDDPPSDVGRPPFTPSDGLGGRVALVAELARVGGQISGATTRRDVPALRACAARIADLAVHAQAATRIRLMVAVLGAHAELAIARCDPTDVAAAHRAAARWAAAADLAGGPDHPLWATITLGQAEAMRRAGDPNLAWSRRLGHSALRAHLWQVLLQSGTDDALTSATAAAAAALTVAAWCRADHAYEELIPALDAGRGLVLYAATTSRGIADQLVDADRADLAERWRTSAGYGRDALTKAPLGPRDTATEIPDDLREQVLRALGADDPRHVGPFAPVNSDNVRGALDALGADALVYLVPETPTQSGMAVVVPARGRVTPVDLPELRVGPGTPIDRYVAGGGVHRDAGPVDSAVHPAAPTVEEICRWAWRTAIGTVLDRTRRYAPGRPVRLVLVPVGMLALVPWHGAFRSDAAGRRFAVEEAVFSYSISARMLCASARQPARPIRTALVVGDPTGDLPFAGAEARAIRDVFHPDATYLGAPDGTGTPEQVLEWIATAGSGASLLHLACHGRVDPGTPLDGHLALAGGTLTVGQMLDACRLTGIVLDQVFLAACTTSLASGTYDEALSLASAFLAAGAGTVFGSLWRVPDAETSLLMYLVHHYLNTAGCAPVDALHRAQLWMLDPRRQPPEGMPSELARHCGSQHAAALAAWAAFIHLGR